MFDTPSLKQKNKCTGKQLKKDCTLFSNLFIICQTCQLDLNAFFTHENQSHPPSISNDGELYETQKADIIHALEELVDTADCEPRADSLIVDGSAFVYSIQPTNGTFEQFAKSFDMHI